MGGGVMDLQCVVEDLHDRYVASGGVFAWHRISALVLVRDGYECHYCGQMKPKMSVDHVIPISDGGDDSMGNLVAACLECNRKKGRRSYDEFLQESPV